MSDDEMALVASGLKAGQAAVLGSDCEVEQSAAVVADVAVAGQLAVLFAAETGDVEIAAEVVVAVVAVLF